MEEQQEVPIRCHQGQPFNEVNGPIRWEQLNIRLSPYRHCSFCGSLHPADVRKILEEGGRLGPTDWKHGTPHKFYVHPQGCTGMYRWYTAHLHDLDDDTFEALAALLAKHIGIEFFRDTEGRLMYRAPYHGYQGTREAKYNYGN